MGREPGLQSGSWPGIHFCSARARRALTTAGSGVRLTPASQAFRKARDLANDQTHLFDGACARQMPTRHEIRNAAPYRSSLLTIVDCISNSCIQLHEDPGKGLGHWDSWERVVGAMPNALLWSRDQWIEPREQRWRLQERAAPPRRLDRCDLRGDPSQTTHSRKSKSPSGGHPKRRLAMARCASS
jgi:hypothetical protein